MSLDAWYWSEKGNPIQNTALMASDNMQGCS